MKKPIFFPLFALLFLLTSCGPPRVTGDDVSARPDDTYIEVSNQTTLANMLIRAPGVQVEGNDPYARVTIRGRSPMYVLDGVRMGYNYFDVSRTVNVNDITAIEVLKNPSETMIYGRDGANGVIVIHTRPFEREN